MPKIFYGGGLVVSDEVFTIEDEDLDEGAPLEVLDLPGTFSDDEDDEEDLSENGKPSEEEIIGLEGTRREADAIIQKAHEDAAAIINKAEIQRKIDHDHMVEQTAVELERIKKEAYQEAYQKGLAEGTQKQVDNLKDCIAQLEDGIGKLAGEQAGFMAEYEYNLKWLAWEIASKVLGRKLEKDETELVSLVKMAVASVKNAEWITVEVSDKMTGLLDALTKEFRRMGDDRIEVRGISAPEDTCIIDTPSGLIDASVYRQLENLRIYFAKEDEES